MEALQASALPLGYATVKKRILMQCLNSEQAEIYNFILKRQNNTGPGHTRQTGHIGQRLKIVMVSWS